MDLSIQICNITVNLPGSSGYHFDASTGCQKSQAYFFCCDFGFEINPSICTKRINFSYVDINFCIKRLLSKHSWEAFSTRGEKDFTYCKLTVLR